jgi:hypothetical protein
MTALQEMATAIERGDSSALNSLISRGAVDVNARLPLARRPPALVYAARHGRAAIVDILLRANARVNEADERGWTAAAAARCHDTMTLKNSGSNKIIVIRWGSRNVLLQKM